jgi:DNA polymerase III delta prime subunit
LQWRTSSNNNSRSNRQEEASAKIRASLEKHKEAHAHARDAEGKLMKDKMAGSGGRFAGVAASDALLVHFNQHGSSSKNDGHAPIRTSRRYRTLPNANATTTKKQQQRHQPSQAQTQALVPTYGTDTLAVTLMNGNRIYVPMTDAETKLKQQQQQLQQRNNNHSDSANDNATTTATATHLLSQPLPQLVTRADEIHRAWLAERQARAIRLAQQSAHATPVKMRFDSDAHVKARGAAEKRRTNNTSTSTLTSPTSTTPTPTSTPTPTMYGDQLWVDKFAPHSFIELLSNEQTNRDVLRALKEWDPYVFGTPALAPKPDMYPNQQNNPEDNKEKEKLSTNKSDDIRPDVQARVMLLCGSPGVGKTTLAHIAAKHAGYRVVEINASDDRSSSVLMDQVKRAMESTTLDFTQQHKSPKDRQKPKPNCIIIDEVDGADAKQALAALVDVIRADKPPKLKSNSKGKGNGPEDDTASSTTNRNKNQSYLRRPIIFIANHKYASALKPLLKYAQIFDVSPPSSLRLMQRCQAVLGHEKSTCQNNQLLSELVSGSGGDIRSCLHTLQFVANSAQDNKQDHRGNSNSIMPNSNKKKRQEVLDISSHLAMALSGGGENGGRLKDQRGDVANVLNTIFRKQRHQRASASSVLANKANNHHKKAGRHGGGSAFASQQYKKDSSMAAVSAVVTVSR